MGAPWQPVIRMAEPELPPEPVAPQAAAAAAAAAMAATAGIAAAPAAATGSWGGYPTDDAAAGPATGAAYGQVDDQAAVAAAWHAQQLAAQQQYAAPAARGPRPGAKSAAAIKREKQAAALAAARAAAAAKKQKKRGRRRDDDEFSDEDFEVRGSEGEAGAAQAVSGKCRCACVTCVGVYVEWQGIRLLTSFSASPSCCSSLATLYLCLRPLILSRAFEGKAKSVPPVHKLPLTLNIVPGVLPCVPPCTAR